MLLKYSNNKSIHKHYVDDKNIITEILKKGSSYITQISNKINKSFYNNMKIKKKKINYQNAF